jgi:low affinity Fe/Cu permease
MLSIFWLGVLPLPAYHYTTIDTKTLELLLKILQTRSKVVAVDDEVEEEAKSIARQCELEIKRRV